MKKVITYGSFDLFHVGHVKLLKRLRSMGDCLIVGLSTDEFNKEKGKYSLIPYEERKEILESCRYVDTVIPETRWEQKTSDIREYDIAVFGIGDDWKGKFDDLKALCEVVYLPRTEGVSSSMLKSLANGLSRDHFHEMKQAVDTLSQIIKSFGD